MHPSVDLINNDAISYVICFHCRDYVPFSGVFIAQDCEHCYCFTCLNLYFERASTGQVTCPPRCCIDQPFNYEYAKQHLKRDVVDAFNDFIRKTQQVSCSDLDCDGIVCGQGVNLGTECIEPELDKLAQQQRWKRCPSCGFLIEWVKGCNRVTCRCRAKFCYACGKLYDGLKPSCCCPLSDPTPLSLNLSLARNLATPLLAFELAQNGGKRPELGQSSTDGINRIRRRRLGGRRRPKRADEIFWWQ